ncbi:MAG: IclR family transcriptional regulator [Bryobacteraceae bacterium]
MKPATTVVKVCRIMDQFRDRSALGVTDLARRTRLLPSDVHRILTSLKADGYISQDPETKQYRLGLAVMRLGLAAFQRSVLAEKARPELVRLSQEIEATTHLGVLDERELEVVLVDQIDASPKKMFRPHLGGAEPLHCTALGKPILAGMNRHLMLYALEKRGLARSTRHTITDVATLERQFQQVRQQGYAVDREESAEGVCCIGSPVRDYTGAVVAAISVSMPTEQFLIWEEADLAACVKAAGAAVSSSLGVC